MKKGVCSFCAFENDCRMKAEAKERKCMLLDDRSACVFCRIFYEEAENLHYKNILHCNRAVLFDGIDPDIIKLNNIELFTHLKKGGEISSFALGFRQALMFIDDMGLLKYPIYHQGKMFLDGLVPFYQLQGITVLPEVVQEFCDGYNIVQKKKQEIYEECYNG